MRKGRSPRGEGVSCKHLMCCIVVVCVVVVIMIIIIIIKMSWSMSPPS